MPWIRRGGVTYPIEPTLLRVCRQPFEESIRVLYGTNTFEFSDASQFDDFIAGRSLTQIHTLGRIRLFCDSHPLFDGWGREWSDALGLGRISQLRGLVYLELHFTGWFVRTVTKPSEHSDQDLLWSALKNFRHLPLREVVVRPNGCTYKKDYGETLKEIKKRLEEKAEEAEIGSEYIRRILMEHTAS